MNKQLVVAVMVVMACGGAQTGSECGRDADCKGDRVCNAGVCVAPGSAGGGSSSAAGGGVSTGGGASSSVGGGSGGGSSSSAGGGSSSAGGGSTSGSCRGDFSINDLPFSGSLAWGPCNGTTPTNCSGGTFLKFNDGTCMCAGECNSSLDGKTCDAQGITVCQNTRNSSGSNHAWLCVATSWNICKMGSTSSAGGGSGSSAGGGSGSSAGGGSGSSTGGGSAACVKAGGVCNKDSECCSDFCSFGECT